MDRDFEQVEEDLPPGFTRRGLTRRSLAFHASSPNMSSENSKEKGKRNRAIPSDEEVINTPNTTLNPIPTPTSNLTKKTKTRCHETQSLLPKNESELSQKTKTHHDMPENLKDVVAKSEPIVVNASDEGTITAADILSFHGENGEVYTLSKPPKAPDLTLVRTLQVDAPSVVCVKKGLISFIMEAGPNDVGCIITQANNIFAFLQAMNANYGSFYNSIRVYIQHCIEWYAADHELKKCKTSEKLVSHYDLLLHYSNEMKKEVLIAEDDIEKAKGYMAPLEARVRDMRDILEKLELELEERKEDLRNIEARKAEKMEEIATLDVELKATAIVAEKTRQLIRENIACRETARISMEKARNQLRII